MMEKSQLRKMMIGRRLNLTKESCAVAGQKICEKLMSWNAYKNADIILSYYPCRNEPDIRPLLLDALKKGRQVAFPKVLGPRQMVFLTVKSLDELKPGYMNIPEPLYTPEPPYMPETPCWPQLCSADITTGRILILVPGTAFCTRPEMAHGSLSAPTVSAPAASVPTVSAPTASVPTVSAPAASVPTVSAPTAAVPTISAPTVSAQFAAVDCDGMIPGPIGRMGYGGGFYDTFLHRLADIPEYYTRVTTCGISYGFQVVSPDVLPIETHDVLLDRLVYDDIY